MPPRAQHRFQGALEEKYCSKCDEWKVLKEFHKQKDKWDGLGSRCKVCRMIKGKNEREKKRQELGKKPRAFAKHRFLNGAKQKYCPWCDTWKYVKEFGKYKRASDGLKTKCKVCQGIVYKKYRRKQMSTEFGRERIRARGRKHNKTRVTNGKFRAYYKKRRRENPAFNIMCRLRCRLWHALKAQGVRKTTSTMKLCGCSLDYLKKYLEKQFVDGMTWENRGKWHIDHIRPCCSFDLTDPEQQKQCFHYSNLQPLWARDNMIKGAKW